MGTPQQPGLRLEFGNLPLVEAAARASFASAVPLKFEIIDQIRERLRGEFPKISEPERVEAAPGIGDPIDLSPGRIPGVMFTGGPSGLVVTLQDRVVIARWLRQIVDSAPDYPRFPALRAALWKAVKAFETASGKRLPIAVVNMSYVNFLDVKDPVGILRDYLSQQAQVGFTDGAKQIHKVEVAWRGSDSVDLRFNIEHVTARVMDQEVKGYKLITIAGIRVEESDDPESKLNEVHGRLQHFFRDLISERAKNEWQLSEAADG